MRAVSGLYGGFINWRYCRGAYINAIACGLRLGFSSVQSTRLIQPLLNSRLGRLVARIRAHRKWVNNNARLTPHVRYCTFQTY